MSNTIINLSKDLAIVLEKKKVPKIVVQVGATFDVSGSAHDMYRNGVIQRAMDRIFVMAHKFDDNQVLDAWAFSNRATELEPIVESMFGNYVDKYIVNNNNVQLWGGTEYLGAMEMILDHYFGTKHQVSAAVDKATSSVGSFVKSLFGSKASKAPSIPATPEPAAATGTDPVYIAFVTDGENDRDEERAIINLITANQDKPIYWMFIGITEHSLPSFTFLAKLAKDFPNVELFNAGKIDSMSNADLYNNLISTKFVDWYNKVKAV